MNKRRRVVVASRNVETLQPLGNNERPSILLPEGRYERLPDDMDASDDAAIQRHYQADEVVRTTDVGFCRGGVLLDGPGAGDKVYAVRRLGAIVEVGDATYRVVDVEPELVRLREV